MSPLSYLTSYFSVIVSNVLISLTKLSLDPSNCQLISWNDVESYPFFIYLDIIVGEENVVVKI